MPNAFGGGFLQNLSCDLNCFRHTYASFRSIFPLLSSCMLLVFSNFATSRWITLFAGNLRLCTLNRLPNSIHVAFKFLLVKKYIETRNTRSSSEYIILTLTCSFHRRSSIKTSLLLYRIQCCHRRSANFTPDFPMNFFVMSVFYGTHCSFQNKFFFSKVHPFFWKKRIQLSKFLIISMKYVSIQIIGVLL